MFWFEKDFVDDEKMDMRGSHDDACLEAFSKVNEG
jgi:hypothetical protein